MSAVSVRGVGYRHASRLTNALTAVDLEVGQGEIVLLTGDSGSGKSTLLHAIAGVLGDEEDGQLTGSISTAGPVGMVLQDPDSQVIAARVGDDVAFGAENLRVPRPEIWRRVARCLELVGLDLPLGHATAQLSGGQKQRLAIAGVLAMGAEVILLDEPTANLDPEGRLAVVEAVGTVVRETGCAVIIAEHRAHHWLTLDPTLYRLEDSGICRLGALPDPPEVPAAIPSSGEPVAWARDLLTQWGPPRTLEVPSGASTVITGANGTGKSTLAMTLGGLMAPRAGVLDYAEAIRRGLRGPSHRWRSSALAVRIGTVFQDPERQFVFRSVREELEASAASPPVALELMDRLRLAHVADANPFTLSGGEKRRLSVATALAGEPTLLICDEPTFGQDDAGFLEMLGLFREWAESGRAVVSITHDELFRRALGDHEVVIR